MSTNRIEVDHTPGGSPVGKAAAAPVYRTVNIRAELLGATEHSGEHVDADHVWRTCKAAAAMGMRNADRYGAENRADAAADAVARLWARSGETGATCRRCGAPAAAMAELESCTPGVTATVPLCHRHAVRAVTRRPLLSNLPSIPADSATFTHALNHVANFRRSLDAQRERDAVDAAARAVQDMTVDPTLEAITAMAGPETYGTPSAARRTAVRMLDDLGLLGATVQRDALWTLAYSVARSSAPDRVTGAVPDSKAIGAELELSAAAVRKHVQRAAERLADLGYGADAFLDALNVPTGGGKGGAAALPISVVGDAVSDDWRTRPGQRVANAAAVVTEGKVSASSVEPTPSAAPADWTAYVSPITAGRLARAAELRDARGRARNDTERAALKSAAGL